MNKIKAFFYVTICILFFLKGELLFTTTKNAMDFLMQSLIPSMFVTMVIIRIMDQLQVLQHFKFSFLSKLFQVDTSIIPYILYSIVLGFPSSAAFIDQAYKDNKINEKGALRLFYTCSFATPSFIIMTCGAVFFHSMKLGYLLFLIHLCSGMILLIFTRKTTVYALKTSILSVPSLSTAFTKALIESGKTLFLLGGYFTLFLCITAILNSFIPLPMILKVILEFSQGILEITSLPYTLPYKLVFSSILLGFGGFCVHMQVKGICETLPYHYSIYFFYRILQSMISGGLMYLFIH